MIVGGFYPGGILNNLKRKFEKNRTDLPSKFRAIFRKGQQMGLKKLIIEQLRKKTSVPGKEKTWIAGLTDDQLFEVFTRLKNGVSAKSIAAHSRDVWHINPGSTIHSISQGILKFRRRIAHLLIAPANSGPPLSCKEGPSGSYDKTPADELQDLAEQQEDRIRRIIREERETGVKYQNLHKDLASLSMLRKAVIKEREYELKHGDAIRTKRIQRIEKDIKKKFDKMLLNLEDDGERLISAANRFLELVEQNAITIEEVSERNHNFE